jgi:hypothetical protein
MKTLILRLILPLGPLLVMYKSFNKRNTPFVHYYSPFAAPNVLLETRIQGIVPLNTPKWGPQRETRQTVREGLNDVWVGGCSASNRLY